jgi:MoaA/NifB/PqqE/SkfB family radical SAM enzyme
MLAEKYDNTPVPQAATVEIGTECVRNCEGCSFKETQLQNLSSQEIAQAITTLSKYWDSVAQLTDHQLIGSRIVELIGGAGVFNKMSEEDIKAMLEVARANNLFQFAVMCDAEKDEEAIRRLFKTAADLETAKKTGMKTVVALSVDALPKDNPTMQREEKSNPSWTMLGNKDEYIKDQETQNFRVFTTISKENLSEIPEIAKQVLESGAVLFIAPLTIHSEEALEGTGVTGRLLMGTNTEILLDESNREEMEGVVHKLSQLKELYPNTFLNVEGTFDNMIECCKPVTEGFRANCKERCAFVTRDREELIATPNFRVMKRPDREDMTLGVCTCMVGPTDDDDDYANTALAELDRIAEGKSTTVELYRKLTADLTRVACPGCNCRTSIDIQRGNGLV